MKALICDLCGRMEPDVPEAALIEGVTISRGRNILLERDVCFTCLEKLIMGFEPKASAAPEAVAERWEAVEKTADYFMEALRGDADGIDGIDGVDGVDGVAPLIDGFAKSETLKPEAVAPLIDGFAKSETPKPEAPATSKGLAKSETLGKRKKQDYGMGTCTQCGKEFKKMAERSRLCSKACVNLDYKAKQKTARTPEVDALMKKLKAENPVPVKRPSNHYDFA